MKASRVHSRWQAVGLAGIERDARNRKLRNWTAWAILALAATVVVRIALER